MLTRPNELGSKNGSRVILIPWACLYPIVALFISAWRSDPVRLEH
jgi:hypothetical protein